MKPFNGPGTYAVFVTVAPNKRNGLKEAFTARIGNAFSEEKARQLITEDRIAMRDTYGGLIDAPGTNGRTYRIFKSAGWTEVK